MISSQCCDHPYLVDWSLRTSLTQDVPDAIKLDAEIRLSNKLHLLHKILLEIRERGLRVLILYQVVKTLLHIKYNRPCNCASMLTFMRVTSIYLLYSLD